MLRIASKYEQTLTQRVVFISEISLERFIFRMLDVLSKLTLFCASPPIFSAFTSPLRVQMGDQPEVISSEKEKRWRRPPRTDQPEELFHPIPRVKPHAPLDAARLSVVLLRRD